MNQEACRFCSSVGWVIPKVLMKAVASTSRSRMPPVYESLHQAPFGRHRIPVVFEVVLFLVRHYTCTTNRDVFPVDAKEIS